MIRRLRDKLTYANVVASLALFVALGGTSYALTLPRNSVGSKQIRTRAVGASEIRKSAVRGNEVRDRSLDIGDLSLGARSSLRGQPGPTGPAGPPGPSGITYRIALNAAGFLIKGGAPFYTKRGTNEYVVEFERPATQCVSTATLGPDEGGQTNPPALPAPGRITVAREGKRIIVRTYDAAGNAASAAFHLIAAC
jgi:hypothetical protein